MNVEYFNTSSPTFDPDLYILAALEDNEEGLTSTELEELTGFPEEIVVESLNRLAKNPEIFMSLEAVGVYFFVKA